MEIIKRIFGGIILDGFLTAVFLMTAYYISTFFDDPKSHGMGIMGGNKMGLYLAGANGLFLGCIFGLMTGLLNQSGVISAAVSGIIFFVLFVCFALITSEEKSLSGLIFILIISVLSALASGITGQLLNTPRSIK